MKYNSVQVEEWIMRRELQMNEKIPDRKQFIVYSKANTGIKAG